jgi:hypothetical protein
LITCKWCDFKDVCHGDKVPQANCRTCINSTPQTKDGEDPWICKNYGYSALDLDTQRAGGECPHHVFIPNILPQCYTVIDAGETWVKYTTSEGEKFYNGCQDDLKKLNVYASSEMEKLRPGQYSAVNKIKDCLGGACLVVDSRGVEHIHDPNNTLPF